MQVAMSGWENFFLAEAGASAALAGLVFVGVSINLTKIMTYPGLPNRALEAFIVLVVTLLVTSLQLVPGQSPVLKGGEVLLIGLSVWLVITRLHIIHLHMVEQRHRWQSLAETLLGQAATLPLIVAGIGMILQTAGSLYWLVPGILSSYLIVFYNAWVLLIEVNR